MYFVMQFMNICTYKLCANGCCDSRIKNYTTRWSFSLWRKI